MKYQWKKNIAIFLSSQAISIFGSSLVQFAITAYIAIQTQSGVYAMAAILCATLPTFLLSPFAGVWADKYNRKKIIILADGGIALCTLAVAFIFLLGKGSIEVLLVALIIRAVGGAIQSPALSAMIPEVVPEEHLTRINGIQGTLQALASLASPALGALLLSFAPIGIVFFVDVITAGLAIVVLLTAFKMPQVITDKSESETGNYFEEMKLGFKYIIRNKFLLEFFGFVIVFFIMLAPVAFLTQVQVTRNYGDSYWHLSVIEIAFSVGMLIGGIIISMWTGLKNKVHTMLLAGILMGATTLLLGTRMSFTFYSIMMGLSGLSLPFMNAPAVTLLQERVEPQYMGRVFGIMTMISTSMMPLGMVIFGPLADKISIEVILIGTGIVIMITAISLVKAKALCTAGYKTDDSLVGKD